MTARRATRQQSAVQEAIHAAGRPLSVNEIHEMAQEVVPSLGVRTVYRVIRRLEEDGAVQPVIVSGQPPRYESAEVAAHHHHHFHCESCDRVFDVPGCAGELERMVPSGFVLEEHEITLRGLCAECS